MNKKDQMDNLFLFIGLMLGMTVANIIQAATTNIIQSFFSVLVVYSCWVFAYWIGKQVNR